MNDAPSDYFQAALEKMNSTDNDLAEVFNLLQSAHDAEDYRATYALATWYLHGQYVEKNLSSALDLLSLAASNNISDACFDLAVCYETGVGVSVNYELAYLNYLKAALWGDVQAIHQVGRCLYHGIGTHKSELEADIWLQRAEILGYEED